MTNLGAYVTLMLRIKGWKLHEAEEKAGMSGSYISAIAIGSCPGGPRAILRLAAAFAEGDEKELDHHLALMQRMRAADDRKEPVMEDWIRLLGERTMEVTVGLAVGIRDILHLIFPDETAQFSIKPTGMWVTDAKTATREYRMAVPGRDVKLKIELTGL